MLHLFKATQFRAPMFLVWFICNQENLGDTNMAKGIIEALEQTAKECDLEINKQLIKPEEVDFYGVHDLPQIIFAIGDSGAKVLKNIIDGGGDKLKATKLAWAGHMIFESLLAIHANLSMISLPVHTLTPEIIQIISVDKLLPTIGVAHNLSLGSLTIAYELWKINLFLPKIPSSAKYFGIFLGGDAPLMDGVTQLIFTPAEAIELAKYVNHLVAHDLNTTLLITNSPRTGRFNAGMQIIPTVHANDGSIPYDVVTDLVSKAFLEALQLPKSRVFFCDFRYGAPGAYQPILALLQKSKDGCALVTGDSTSMVSEICDVLAKKHIIIARIGSMNAVHHAHVDSMSAVGHLVINNHLANGFTAEDVPRVFDEEECFPAAVKIATQLCNIIKPQSPRLSLNLSG